MEKKVYVFEWSYNHRGEFDCGYEIYPTLEEAIKDMEDCYKQAIINITPNCKEEELDDNSYTLERTKNAFEHGYYYVERYAADSWERGVIEEKTIKF